MATKKKGTMSESRLANLHKAQAVLAERRARGEKIGGRPRKNASMESTPPSASSAEASSAASAAMGSTPSATTHAESPSTKSNGAGGIPFTEIPPRADAGERGPQKKAGAPGAGPTPGASPWGDKKSLAKQIQGFHELAALFTGIEELRIHEHESIMLADAAADVMQHYSIEIDPKHAALVKLAAAAGMVYGPRAFVLVKKSQAAKAQRQDRVRPIRPGIDPRSEGGAQQAGGFDPYQGGAQPSGQDAQNSATMTIPPGAPDDDSVTH